MLVRTMQTRGVWTAFLVALWLAATTAAAVMLGAGGALLAVRLMG